MATLRVLCSTLAFVPIGMGLAISLGGVRVLDALFASGLTVDPTLRSIIRFLGGCFAGLGVAAWLACRHPERHATILISIGGALMFGVVGRMISLASDGWPGTLTVVLGGAELAAGLAFAILGFTSRPHHLTG